MERIGVADTSVICFGARKDAVERVRRREENLVKESDCVGEIHNNTNNTNPKTSSPAGNTKRKGDSPRGACALAKGSSQEDSFNLRVTLNPRVVSVPVFKDKKDSEKDNSNESANTTGSNSANTNSPPSTPSSKKKSHKSNPVSLSPPRSPPPPGSPPDQGDLGLRDVLIDPSLHPHSTENLPLNIYGVANCLSQVFGWNLNSLQNPASVHLCVTFPMAQGGIVEEFIRDVKSAIFLCRTDPEWNARGCAGIYGTTANVPTALADELTCVYLDACGRAWKK